MTEYNHWVAIFVFIFGALIGSFLNVVIYRVPKGESVAFPASHCPTCNSPLRWFHNIPIFSWIFLRGKCSFCKEIISAQYLAIEGITGILFVLLYLKIGLAWHFPFVAFSFASLLALVMIDFKYMAVPDSINIAALLFALVQPTLPGPLFDAIYAAGGLFLIAWIASLVFKKEAMGSADVIVAGTMGALLGFPNFFVAIFLAALLALLPLLLHKDKPIPFIPFLATSTLIIYVYDSQSILFLYGIIYP